MLTAADVTIPKRGTGGAPSEHLALFAEGLAYIRAKAGASWTDHNIHDPGITTLELLCYALTDLVYRASYSIPDLLATGGDDAAVMRSQFYTAREILPSRPVTARDYRKLLIDVEGVSNAWIRPAAATNPPSLLGIYDVLLEYVDGMTAAARDDALRSARQTLHANRNLCEDFARIDEVATQRFALCAELELAPDADITSVHAEILFRAQQYLAPPVFQYRLGEMLARTHADGTPYAADEIFNGPPLAHGFIDDAELAATELRTEIRLSDLIAQMMAVPGVRAVRDAKINAVGGATPDDRWRVPVDAGMKPTLDFNACRLVSYKRGMPFTSDAAQLATWVTEMVRAANARDAIAFAEDLPIPVGRFRNASTYLSVQREFPAIYGAGDTRQFSAYLAFFDQVMADFVAQIGDVRDLFGYRDGGTGPTYRHQVVDTMRGWESIYTAGPSGADAVNASLASLDDEATLVDRRNRFLDNLIARVGERFHDFVAIMRGEFGASPAMIAEYKRAFLSDAPRLGAERGLAYDDSLQDDDALWNSDNVSGFERRVAALLGIADTRRRNLGEIAHDIYPQIDETPGDQWRFRVRERDTGKIVLSSTRNYATAAHASAALRIAITAARDPGSIARIPGVNGGLFFHIADESGFELAWRDEQFTTDAEREAAIDELLAYVVEEFNEEGMYVIENLLLRPSVAGDPPLPTCVDVNCDDCADEDPYSYRMHVVLPAYGLRFDDMTFRRWAEQVIREEVPAHIQPKVCWISAEDMAELEPRYRAWISLRSGRDTANRATTLQQLIDTLYRVKNVYPMQQLHECDAPETETKFVLGQTALGSKR